MRMTQGVCTDKAGLIGFLYDDCEPGERDRLAAHVADCPECTAELAALSATRDQLAAWVPPAFAEATAGKPWALGFQIDPAQMGEPLKAGPFSTVDGGKMDAGRAAPDPAPPWWKQPLPAWAQAAAAVLIFAAGVGFGSGTGTGTPDAPRVEQAAARQDAPETVRVTPVASVAPTVAPEEFARLEQKLQAMQAELAALRAGAGTPVRGNTDDAVTLAQVKDVVAETEGKLLRQLLLRDAAWQTAREEDRRQFEGLVTPLRGQAPSERLPSFGGPTIGLEPVRRVSYPR
jgi:hypothetical protein